MAQLVMLSSILWSSQSHHPAWCCTNGALEEASLLPVGSRADTAPT